MYCSARCKEDAASAFWRAERRRMRAGRKCRWCNGIIPVERTAVARYCCETCKRTHDQVRRLRESHVQTCAACGEAFVSHRRQSFCSRKCAGQDKKAGLVTTWHGGRLATFQLALTARRFDIMTRQHHIGIRHLPKRRGRKPHLTAARFDAMMDLAA